MLWDFTPTYKGMCVCRTADPNPSEDYTRPPRSSCQNQTTFTHTFSPFHLQKQNFFSLHTRARDQQLFTSKADVKWLWVRTWTAEGSGAGQRASWISCLTEALKLLKWNCRVFYSNLSTEKRTKTSQTSRFTSINIQYTEYRSLTRTCSRTDSRGDLPKALLMNFLSDFTQ